MGDRKEELRTAKISHAHLLFTIESAAAAHKVITAYKKGEPLDGQVRRIGKRQDGNQKVGAKEHGGFKNGKKKL